MLARTLLALALAMPLLAACGGAAAQPQTVSPPVTLVPPEATPLPTQAAAEPTAAPATAAPEPTAPEPTVVSEPSAAPPSPTAAPATPAAAPGDELLFLRGGALIAHDLGSGVERQLAEQVLDFAPAPDGRSVALIRDLGKGVDANGIDLWLVGRDGGGLRQLTRDSSDLIEATPAWAPDSAALAYAASRSSDAYARTWQEWAAWCDASTVHVLDLASGADQGFGAGCDPAISPDGKRIAFATAPTVRVENPSFFNAANAIRLINRLGQNGWKFAEAAGAPGTAGAKQGLLVYAPAWSPDSAQIVYQRFLGYQALVDINLSEIGGSLEGKGKLLADGAGWMLPARFAPGGGSVALVENNYSDARGFGGYDNWSVSVLSLAGTHEVTLPEGTFPAVGQRVDKLARAQAAAWSPDGAALAVLLPPGWNPNLPNDEPVGGEEQPGEIWRWRPGSPPEQQLVANVDFGSPIFWLAAAQ